MFSWVKEKIHNKKIVMVSCYQADADSFAGICKRLFCSRLYVTSSWHLLRGLSDGIALQQCPKVIHFGFLTASRRCNEGEKNILW